MTSKNVMQQTMRDVDDFTNSPLHDFYQHFRSLIDNNVCFEIIGRLPEKNVDGPRTSHETSIYCGKNWSMAFRKVLKWNSKGYTILFSPTNAKGCIDLKWFGFSALYNRSLIRRADATEHAMDLNSKEFDGNASILDAGDRFWFLIKMPKQNTIQGIDPYHIRKNQRWYLTNLGLNWNIATKDALSFHIDNIDFFPSMEIPAAGLWNYNLKPPYRICWINDIVDNAIPGILSKILSIKDPIGEIKKLYPKLDSSALQNALSILDYNFNFSEEKLVMLLEQDIVAKKIFEDVLYQGKHSRSAENSFQRILFLIAFFRAPPNTIIKGLTLGKRQLHHGAGNYNMFDCSNLSKDIIAIYEYLKKVQGEEGKQPIRDPPKSLMHLDAFNIMSNSRNMSSESCQSDLFQRYGPQIHFPRNGVYIFRIEAFPQEVIVIEDAFYRTRSYVPIPCFFHISANGETVGPGALIIHRSTASTFLDRTIRSKGTGGLILAYFWYFGRKFLVFKIPEDRFDGTAWSFKKLDHLLLHNFPELIQIRKRHLRDQFRKSPNTIYSSRQNNFI